MADKRVPSRADLKAGHGEALEHMVLGLFRPNRHQVFEARELNVEAIAEFCQSEEVFGLSLKFANDLRELWAARHPDGPGLRSVASVRVEPWRLPMLEPAPDQSMKDTMNESHPASREPGSSSASPEPAHPAPAAPADVAPGAVGSMNTASGSPSPVTSAAVSASFTPQQQQLKPGQIPPASSAPPPRPAPAIRTTFHLPNCRVGVAYAARISGTDAGGAQLIVTDMQIPVAMGLHFDPAEQMVSGEPQQDGEFALGLHWRYENSTAANHGVCHLIANPDPKSLWKVNEPAPGQAYPKPHLDLRLIDTGSARMLAASRRGRSHEHGGTYRDDDFFLAHDPASGWSVMLVADGAGSAKSSREGARLAVQTAGAQVVAQLTGEFGTRAAALIGAWDGAASQQVGNDFHYLFHTAATSAVQAIEQEAQQSATPVREFATTLLAVVTRRDGEHTFIASFWMGDGAIAAYGPRGTVKLMGTPDSGEFAGQTRFLDRAAVSDAGFGKRVRIGRLSGIDAVIMMTDGVSDPYFETDNGLADGSKWDALWDDLAPHLQAAVPEQAVLDWLHFFRQGHHDDRTIAILW